MSRKTDPLLDSFGTLVPRQPTLRERLVDALARNITGDDREGVSKAEFLMRPLDLTPIETVMGFYDAGREVGSGNYFGALGAVGLAALPGPDSQVKSIAKALAGREKSMASKSPLMYNPKPRPQREFAADYPNGAASDEAGRLTADIDGRPIFPEATVVGRRMAGGRDEALPTEKLYPLSEALTGSSVKRAPSREIGGDAGRYEVTSDRRSGAVLGRNILIDKSLPPAQEERVLAHELAHAVHDIAGEVPAAGLNDELRAVYNDLNNPQGHGRLFGPEQHGYRGTQVGRELMAEAIRAYKADPNYLKTVVPRTAAAIRAAWNSNPKYASILHFNSLAPMMLGAGLVVADDEGQR